MKATAKRDWIKTAKGLVKAILPYGIVCWWRRRVWNEYVDAPLFYYRGVAKQLRRVVKFSLPYGLVMKYRVRQLVDIDKLFARGKARRGKAARDVTRGIKTHGGLRVTCVIPNYNYAHFLKARIDDVLRQTYSVDELILLDDNSTDNSDEVIREMLPTFQKRFPRGVKYIRNAENAGVFRQWHRGFKEATGDLVWVAEADDSCSAELIASLVPFFADEKVGLAYADSCVGDEFNHVTEPSFGQLLLRQLSHYPPPPHTHTTRMKWHSDYVNDGRREILECLAIQNTIPNASGVLFRRAAVLDIPTDSWFRYQGLGDWFAYLHVALNWRIAFCARVLNGHRRHSKSVIARIQERAIREHRMIQEYIARKCDLPRATLDAQRDFIRKLSQS